MNTTKTKSGLFRRGGAILAVCLMALAQTGSAALPSGYTQLAFLESSGTQYIDTGVVFGKTNGFSVTSQIVAPVNNQIVCGSRVDGGDTRCMVGANRTDRGTCTYVGWNGIKTSYWVVENDMGTTVVNFLNSGTYDCRRVATGSLDELTAQTSPSTSSGPERPRRTASSTAHAASARCRSAPARMSFGTSFPRSAIPIRYSACMIS